MIPGKALRTLRLPAACTGMKPRFGRCRSGFSLVEILVSVLLGSLIAGTMVDMYSKVQRINATSQNEQCANIIVRELLEQTRGLDYQFLFNHQGQIYDLPVNRIDAGMVPTDVRNEPVLLDIFNKVWNSKSSGSRFNGKVSYEIGFLGSDPNSIKVQVKASWSDGERNATSSGGAGRTITASTVVTRTGTNLWSP